MENVHYVTYGWVGVIVAIVCGKWAMEVAFRQSRQVIWMIAGLLIPPIALLALYVRLLRQARKQGQPGGDW